MDARAGAISPAPAASLRTGLTSLAGWQWQPLAGQGQVQVQVRVPTLRTCQWVWGRKKNLCC
jgi:hypothetical protein